MAGACLSRPNWGYGASRLRDFAAAWPNAACLDGMDAMTWVAQASRGRRRGMGRASAICARAGYRLFNLSTGGARLDFTGRRTKREGRGNRRAGFRTGRRDLRQKHRPSPASGPGRCSSSLPKLAQGVVTRRRRKRRAWAERSSGSVTVTRPAVFSAPVLLHTLLQVARSSEASTS